jgi:integrase
LLVAETFKQLADDYLSNGASHLSDNSRAEVKRYLKKDIVPALGVLRINDITGAEIVALVKRVARRSHTVARRTFEIVSVIFAHGVANLSAKSNPCAGLKVSAIIGTRPKRERIKLTEDELRAVLGGVPRLGVKNALAIRILLATCVRKGELLRAKWEHIDLEAGLWRVPDENSKSKRGFTIPLPPTVVRWFNELKAIACGSAWVLPGQRLTEPMCRSTLNVALDRLGCDVRRFTPHDLRSTARSHLAALGVDIVVAERCLNHSLGGLVAVYDRHDYLEERRRALELWAGFIEACEHARPWNVMPLRTAAIAA